MPTIEHNESNYQFENQDNVSFASRHPHRVFACHAVEFAIVGILRIAAQTRDHDGDVLVGVYDVVFRSNCEEDIHSISPGVLKRRTSLLHTLHHRTVPICVSDFLCAVWVKNSL